MAGDLAGDEALDQDGNVILPFAQGRDVDTQHVEAEEQVLTERALAHGPLEIRVGRGDQADPRRQLCLTTDTIECSLLQQAQEMALLVDRQIADLVEEHRAVLGLFDEAAVAAVGTGEGAAFVAEQFAN